MSEDNKEIDVRLVKHRKVKNAKVIVRVHLETGKVYWDLSWTCTKCAGYGCRHGNAPCNTGVSGNTIVRDAVGHGHVDIIEREFKKMISNLQATGMHVNE